jgi:serine/threonine-protein kinase RsbW
VKPENNRSRENKLVVKSRTENLSVIRNFIAASAEQAGMSKEELNDIILAVDEACTNIIKHAYNSVPDGEIIITIDRKGRKFTVTIIDYGKNFEPEIVKKPDIQEYYRQKKVGGLGMYLMKTLMDEVKYISVPGKYNKVLMSKFIA